MLSLAQISNTNTFSFQSLVSMRRKKQQGQTLDDKELQYGLKVRMILVQ